MTKTIAYVFGLAVTLAFCVEATPILNDSSLWNATATPPPVWDVRTSPNTDQLGATVLDTPGGNTAQLRFVGGGAAPDAWIYAKGGNFVGDLTGYGVNLNVNFTFNSIDVAPNQTPNAGLYVFFLAGNGDLWSYSLAAPVTTGINYYGVNIGSGNGWTTTNTPLSSFWSDLSSVSQFGFEVVGGNLNADQRYQFSDVYFSIPEPETVWMMLAVLASLAITFRSRLMELAGQIKLSAISRAKDDSK